MVDQPFSWPPRRNLRDLRVGYVKGRVPEDERPELAVLRELGVQLLPIELPQDQPIQAVTMMLGTEAGAVFDPLTRAGITEGLNNWPDTFRLRSLCPPWSTCEPAEFAPS